ncbi:MAG: hypothetical protein ABIJ84_00520, partial [bacterium]
MSALLKLILFQISYMIVTLTLTPSGDCVIATNCSLVIVARKLFSRSFPLSCGPIEKHSALSPR